jgi:hypothetical protein
MNLSASSRRSGLQKKRERNFPPVTDEQFSLSKKKWRAVVCFVPRGFLLPSLSFADMKNVAEFFTIIQETNS